MPDDLLHDLLEHLLHVDESPPLLIQQFDYVVLDVDGVEHLDGAHHFVEFLEVSSVLVDVDQVGEGADEGVDLLVVDLFVVFFEVLAVVVQFDQFVLLQLESVQQDLFCESVFLELQEEGGEHESYLDAVGYDDEVLILLED